MTHGGPPENSDRSVRLSMLALAAIAMVAARASAQSSPPPSTSPPALPQSLASLLRAHPIPGARIGIRVIAVETGRVLFEHDADVALNPASNTKIVTAAAALALLGADHRFVTRVEGRITGDRIRGDLWLVGGGDPSLRTADLYEFARLLAARGVRAVEGAVVVDDSASGGEVLPPSFEQQPRESAAFRAMVSAASVDENAITVRIAPSERDGVPAVVSADPPGYVVLDAEVRTSAPRTPPHVELSVDPASGGRERVRVRGTVAALGDEQTFRRRLTHPSRATAEAFRAALESVGIHVHGGSRIGAVPADLPVLESRTSEDLARLLNALGKDSNNFYAETILLAMGADEGHGPATFARAVERVLGWLRSEGVTSTTVQLRNGSGLFDANRVDATTLAEVLRAAYRDPDLRDEFVAQLAVSGETGTLRRRMHIPGAERRVRAKTGTLDDVIALSGYVLGHDPCETTAFVFIANGVRGHHAEARAIADGLVAQLVAQP